MGYHVQNNHNFNIAIILSWFTAWIEAIAKHPSLLRQRRERAPPLRRVFHYWFHPCRHTSSLHPMSALLCCTIQCLGTRRPTACCYTRWTVLLPTTLCFIKVSPLLFTLYHHLHQPLHQRSLPRLWHSLQVPLWTSHPRFHLGRV